MNAMELTETSTRFINAMHKRYKLVKRLRVKLEHAEGLETDPLLEHVNEVENALEKVVSRLWFLTCRVQEQAERATAAAKEV